MKRIFLTLLILMWCGSAWGATYYLADAAAGSGNGSSCANAVAYTTFSSITAGDTAYLCGTITHALTTNHDGTTGAGQVYLYPALTKYGASSNGGATITTSSGTALYVTKNYWNIAGLTWDGSGTNTNAPLYIDGTSANSSVTDCVLKNWGGNLTIKGVNTLIAKNDFQGVFSVTNNAAIIIKSNGSVATSGTFEWNKIRAGTKSTSHGIQLQSSTYHPNWNFYNDEIYPYFATPTAAIWSSATGGTSVLYNNIVAGNIQNTASHTITNSNNDVIPYGKSPTTNYLLNVTPGAGTICSNPKKKHYSRQGYIIFSVDDGGNAVYAADMATILAGYGKHMMWAVSGYEAATYATQMQAIAASGNDIGVHAYNHADVTLAGDLNLETVTAKSTIESTVGNGYVAKTYVYPGNISNPTVRAAVKTAGFTNSPGAAGTSNANDTLSNFDIYQYYRIDPTVLQVATCGGSIRDETSVRCNIRALAITAAENGLVYNLTFHDPLAIGFANDAPGRISMQNTITWLLDGISKIPEISVVNNSEFANTVRTSGNWVTTADPVMTRAIWTDQFDGSLLRNSPAINAGTNLCVTLTTATDFAGKPVCTGGVYVGKGSAPEIGAYEYIPKLTGGSSFQNFNFSWGW